MVIADEVSERAAGGRIEEIEMQGYNAILVYDSTEENLLFCYRIKEPYKGKYNFVGGKIEEDEDGTAAAYRELYEETGISEKDIEYIYILYSYPEKFYKISNQYINSPKNWISPKMIEKLDKVIKDEGKKLELLEKLKTKCL